MLHAKSPLFHSENIVRPLMVLQGANDPRVIQVESDEIVEAVKKTAFLLNISSSRMRGMVSITARMKSRPTNPFSNFWINISKEFPQINRCCES
jgi:hypothetical protein